VVCSAELAAEEVTAFTDDTDMNRVDGPDALPVVGPSIISVVIGPTTTDAVVGPI